MKFNDLSKSEMCFIAKHWPGITERDQQQTARWLGVSVSYLDRQLAWVRNYEQRPGGVTSTPKKDLHRVTVHPTSAPENTTGALSIPEYPPSPSKEWTDWLEIDCENAIIIADVEMPDYDADLMRLAHAMAVKHNIKTLLIGGDYDAFDTITPWSVAHRDNTELTLRETFALDAAMLDTAMSWFDDVYAVMGNHDQRWSKLLDGQLGPYDVIHTSNGQVIVKPYTYMYLNTSRGKYKLTHPKNYSKNQLTTPRNIIQKESERCHIISTHTHHCCKGFDQSGQWVIAEIGCLRNPKATKYKQTGDTNHPQWVQGFAMLLDGYLHVLPKEHTDWRRWLGDDLHAQLFATQRSQRTVAIAA